jgi:hypothetical protein
MQPAITDNWPPLEAVGPLLPARLLAAAVQPARLPKPEMVVTVGEAALTKLQIISMYM